MRMVSVDPGLRGCGVAEWRDGKLNRAIYVRNTEKVARGPKAWNAMARAVWFELRGAENAPDPADEIVIEVMKVYRFQKGDPADLIELSGVGGAIIAPSISAHGYLAREWKGQVPKDVMGSRIEAVLSETEKAAIEKCPKSLRHNVLDGVGIGLHHLGRL